MKREPGGKWGNSLYFPKCYCCQPFASRGPDVAKQKRLGRRYSRHVTKQNDRKEQEQ